MVLRSGKVNYWTGEEGRLFEKEFAAFIGCKHAIALANGTVALELALRAVGVAPGDEVIVPARTYFATASCVVAVGAKPVFADVDDNSQNVSAATIRNVVSPRTRALIVVHLAGFPCDVDDILALAGELHLPVIEDCAQAHGATYKGRPVGSFGDVGAFSFCQDKIMTTAGEGGMVTTNSEDLWRRMWAYKDHGKSHDLVYRQSHPAGFRWLHDSFGTNWRLSEVQSAIGRIQLRKLPLWSETRRKNAAILTAHLSRFPSVRLPQLPDPIEHAFYKFYMFVEPKNLVDGWNRDRIMAAVIEQGIACFVGSCSEVYREAAFPVDWRPREPLAVARSLGETSLMLLVHPTLTAAHMHYAGERIATVLKQAQRP